MRSRGQGCLVEKNASSAEPAVGQAVSCDDKKGAGAEDERMQTVCGLALDWAAKITLSEESQEDGYLRGDRGADTEQR